jgi:hypothetical protein
MFQMDNRSAEHNGLQALAPTEWFAQPATSSVWLRIYLCLFVPHDVFPQAVTSMLDQAGDGDLAMRPGSRMLFACGWTNDLKVPSVTFEMMSSASGQLAINAKVDSRELPKTPYVFLATPHRSNGGDGDEGGSRRILDEAAALMCLHTGQNVMRHIVFEGEVDAAGDKMHVPSDAVKMPHPVEGPFLSLVNGADIMATATSIRTLNDDNKRRRLLLALQLVDQAMRSRFGFLEYWTALEVVCDGRAGSIKTALSKILGLQNHNEAATVSRLGVLAEWRHAYVHQGIAPNMNVHVERYLQLLFLDLLRHQLGLEYRAHFMSLQTTHGVDLSQLGVAPQNPVRGVNYLCR